MKYVVLIHSNPDPWGHPTIDFTPEGQAIPAERRAVMDRDFDALLAELNESGEFVVAEALAAPSSSTVYRWDGEKHVTTDGPFAETKEQLAGFFLIDCETRERAEAVAARFAGPGDVVELRPSMYVNEGPRAADDLV
ncbi:YciI family protein [Luteimicrobium xylanilyticum]|uniref:YCII-related domain-containing protein n=1 Tax=Luteimicrobium xylanilyticum TaxID=1133546 RepID=A0A5P9Q5R5_9MICO|nr:YciI family protein [Luteimicrobium xylanilyticum]QFU96721.1 hypothetical protein KDY119_00208 [Luteimicrobium xylanilyticum]